MVLTDSKCYNSWETLASYVLVETWFCQPLRAESCVVLCSLPPKAVAIMSTSSSSPSLAGSDTTNSSSPTTSTTSSTPSTYKDSDSLPWIIYHIIEAKIPCELPLRIMFSFNAGMSDETTPVTFRRQFPNLCVKVKSYRRSRTSISGGHMSPRASSSQSSSRLSTRLHRQSMIPR